MAHPGFRIRQVLSTYIPNTGVYYLIDPGYFIQRVYGTNLHNEYFVQCCKKWGNTDENAISIWVHNDTEIPIWKAYGGPGCYPVYFGPSVELLEPISTETGYLALIPKSLLLAAHFPDYDIGQLVCVSNYPSAIKYLNNPGDIKICDYWIITHDLTNPVSQIQNAYLTNTVKEVEWRRLHDNHMC